MVLQSPVKTVLAEEHLAPKPEALEAKNPTTASALPGLSEAYLEVHGSL